MLAEQNRIERSTEARRLIIHADDLAMSRSVNEATFAAFEAGAISSSSAMAPCPYVPEVAAFAQRHPTIDIGLHLTLTSDCPNGRWHPLSSSAEREGLCDDTGAFHGSIPAFQSHAGSVGAELLAQFACLRRQGIYPTHIDSHMMSAFRPDHVLHSYLRGAKACAIPAFVPQWARARALRYASAIGIRIPQLNVFTISPAVSPEDWLDFYLSVPHRLPQGLNLLLVHLGFDTAELRTVRSGRSCWDSAWRQRDFNAITSASFQDVLAVENIQMVRWRDIPLAESTRSKAEVLFD